MEKINKILVRDKTGEAWQINYDAYSDSDDDAVYIVMASKDYDPVYYQTPCGSFSAAKKWIRENVERQGDAWKVDMGADSWNLYGSLRILKLDVYNDADYLDSRKATGDDIAQIFAEALNASKNDSCGFTLSVSGESKLCDGATIIINTKCDCD